MCYIFGVIGKEADKKDVAKYADLMDHRGPDYKGDFKDENVFIQQGTLAFNDTTKKTQPFHFIDDFKNECILAVNGEIYNHLSLYDELVSKGYKQAKQTKSDCEIIYHVYKFYGMYDFIYRLDGMFTFILYDLTKAKVIVGRDYGGINSLMWGSEKVESFDSKTQARWDNGFESWENLPLESFVSHRSPTPKYFASELNSLDKLGLDYQSKYNKEFVFEQFPHGHYYVCDAVTGQGELKQWFTLDKTKWNFKDESDRLVDYLIEKDTKYVEDYKKGAFDLLYKCTYRPLYELLVQAAVKQWTMRDPSVKFVILLSGGLDSSIYCGIIAEYNRRLLNHENVGIWKSPYNDHYWPLETACAGIKHNQETKILSTDIFEARKVAELHHTQHYEFLFTVEEVIASLPKIITSLQTIWTTTVRASTLLRLMLEQLHNQGFSCYLTGSASDEIFGGYLYFHKCPSAEELHKEVIRKVSGLPFFDTWREYYIGGSVSMECRPLFFDKDVLEFSVNVIPPSFKLCGYNGKIEKDLLRETFKELLPDDVYHRTKVQASDGYGFSLIDTLRLLESPADESKDSYNKPRTKEEMYYRYIFDQHFKHPCSIRCVPSGRTIACSSPAALKWDAEFAKNADDSGRSIKDVHVKEHF